MIEKLLALFASEQPIFFLLAGPNGAGKSTFRAAFLNSAGIPCIDPDEVAKGLFGTHPRSTEESLAATIEAGRRVDEWLQTGTSFGLETVFSDSKGIKLDLLKRARDAGYRVGLIFIGVNDPDLSIMRVASRVEEGGHDVPDERIRARFPRAFDNLRRAVPLSDFVLLVDNSGERRHRVFGVIDRRGQVELWDEPPRWFSQYGVGK
jgi:predicted ABC-type ATPase